MVWTKLNTAHKKGASTKHQITKNPRQQKNYIVSTNSGIQKFHSKQANHPVSIWGTKVPRTNLETRNKNIEKGPSKKRTLVDGILIPLFPKPMWYFSAEKKFIVI